MNEEYIPTPTRNATRLVVHTPWMRIIAMSTSGSSERSSVSAPGGEHDEPGGDQRRCVLAEPQPQVVVWLTATRTITSPSDISAAASQLTLPGALIGDSGT